MRTNKEVIDYLNSLRKEQNMSISELARRVGMAKSGVSKYFNHTREFPINRINEFSKALHTNPEKILGIDVNNQHKQKFPTNAYYLYDNNVHAIKIPIIGTIACGQPILADQNIEGYTTEFFKEPPTGTIFALRCQGDSMEPTIPNGAMVTIHEQPNVEDGEIAAVLVDNNTEATLKRVKHVASDQILLIPENNKYDPILLNKDFPGHILGKVIHVGFDL